jgi:hypothetical protein
MEPEDSYHLSMYRATQSNPHPSVHIPLNIFNIILPSVPGYYILPQKILNALRFFLMHATCFVSFTLCDFIDLVCELQTMKFLIM